MTETEDARDLIHARGAKWLLRISVVLLACLLPDVSYAASILATVGPVPGFGYPPGTTTLTPGAISYSDASGGDATASVSFGGASVFANSNCGGSINCGVTAHGDFSDAITIFGTSGFLEVEINSTSFPHFGDGLASTGFVFGSFSGGSVNGFGNGLFSYQQSFTDLTRVVFSGTANVTASDFAPGDPNSGAETDQAFVNFSFAVLDSNGQPLSGFHYTSDSGTDYGLNGGVFVPEPTTAILTLTGLLSMILLRVRRVPKFQFFHSN